MKALFNKFINDESGATAIEYGLIAALIAVACVTAMTQVGSQLEDKFEAVRDELQNSNTTGG